MQPEPSLGELGRRLDDLQNRIQRLVSQDLFIAEQRVAERRFAGLEEDFDELRRRFEDELRALTARVDARERDRGANWRQSVYAGVIPAALLIVSLFVQIWLSLKGASS
jgi:hypothetical protein